MNKTQTTKINDIIKMLNNNKMLGYSVRDHKVLISPYMVIKTLDIDFTCFTGQSMYEGDFNERFYNKFNTVTTGFLVNVNELIETMKGFNNKNHVIKLVSNDDKLTLIITDIKQSEILKTHDIHYSGDPMKIAFNLKWFKKLCELIKAFDGASDIEIRYTSGVQPARITSPSFNIVLAPVRISN